jgi:cell fate regulator YaaT (PSP1 superfamily)
MDDAFARRHKTMTWREYLVRHGSAGDVGRFQATADFCPGDRVVVRGRRGLEIGSVLCAARPLHQRLIEGAGELVRLATADDEQIARGIAARSQQLFEEGRRLAADLALPLELLDVDITLDGHQVTLFYLSWQACDPRPLVSALSKKYEVLVAGRDLALPAGATACGRPDCGQPSGQGCTNCTSGGCSTGCGSPARAREVQQFFASLRQKMEDHHRLPLEQLSD